MLSWHRTRETLWWERPFRPWLCLSRSIVVVAETLWFRGLMIRRHASNERKYIRREEEEGHYAIGGEGEVLANMSYGAISKQHKAPGNHPLLDQVDSNRVDSSPRPTLRMNASAWQII